MLFKKGTTLGFAKKLATGRIEESYPLLEQHLRRLLEGNSQEIGKDLGKIRQDVQNRRAEAPFKGPGTPRGYRNRQLGRPGELTASGKWGALRPHAAHAHTPCPVS
jgi:hypothetical protein